MKWRTFITALPKAIGLIIIIAKLRYGIKKLSKFSPDFPLVVYYYGQALLHNEKYEEARDQFSEFITNMPANGENSDIRDKAKLNMKKCSFGLTHASPVNGITTWKVDSILNNGTAIFGASYFGSETVIAYSSSTVVQGNSSDGEDYNLLFSSYDNNNWDEPDFLASPIKSSSHEASLCINKKGSRLYFTRWNDEECAIYASNNFNGSWMEPFKLKDINMDGYRTMNANLSPDNKTLYFRVIFLEVKGGWISGNANLIGGVTHKK